MGNEISLTLLQMGRSLAWAVVAAVSFAFAMGLSIKVFDWMISGFSFSHFKNASNGVSGM